MSHGLQRHSPRTTQGWMPVQKMEKVICLVITLTTLPGPVLEGECLLQPSLCKSLSHKIGARLNAIMLGRLRMRVEDCLKRYPEMAQNVFSGKKRSKFIRIMTLTSTKYDSAKLEVEIKKIVEYKAPPNATPLQQEFAFDKYHSPYDLCKT